jgi:hypothetical protein
MVFFDQSLRYAQKIILGIKWYAAQGITQIDAEIAEKGHFWVETIEDE